MNNMAGEKVLLVGDSLDGPTGFAINGGNIAWSLAKDYDVHYLGLQSMGTQEMTLNIEDEERTITHHANLPRSDQQWDFGFKSLPVLLDNLEPDVLFTINDIQMIQHIPGIMCPNAVQIPVVDLPSKEFVEGEALKRKLQGEVQKFREKYPRETKWIAYCPQDGDPPMSQWGYVYNMADKVVAMSKYGQAVFKNYFDMDVPYIWHGADSTIFDKDERPEHLDGKFVVGDINRNQPRKQPVRAIEAFAKFAEGKDDVLLHLQKDWNDVFGWPLKYFTDMYGVTSKCIKPGRVGMPKEEVAKCYNAWDVNLMTTGGEGFGLAFAESMMCGTPNIACDYTTPKELIDDKWPRPRGLLVDFDLVWQKMDVAAVRRSYVKIDSLVDALEEYYNDREKLAKHSENAYKFAQKNLAIGKQQKQWRDLVKETLNEE